MNNGWLITFANGDQETIDDRVDSLKVGVDGTMLYALQKMNYGPDVVIATYPICNIRKWEKVQ